MIRDESNERFSQKDNSIKKIRLYQNIEISDIIKKRANQFEGSVPNYDLPDQKAYLIKLHG